MKWLQWMEEKWGKGKQGSNRIKTYRWLLLLGLVGVGFVIFSSFLTVESLEPVQDRASPSESQSGNQEAFFSSGEENTLFADYEKQYEDRMTAILSKIVGVGGVDVMVSIESTEEKVVYQNSNHSQQVTNEKDRDGGTRHITSINKSGDLVLIEVSGEKQPIIIKTIKPEIRGVIIVANGAENPTVKKLILDSVTKGLDVPVHRISVVPRKQP
ncbi:stage III sporulation protein AG [Marinicrinis sediminis]|uniref:Stage III sporulation protein AG n=1 Tax=Marinicrinis sediminis TaxID=1652465 RepID=A0ABW5RED7_9BACL